MPIDPRQTRPETPEHLDRWLRAYTGISFAKRAVCKGHDAPWDAFCCWYFDRPPVAITLGPRGGGKSFGSGLHTHLDCRFQPGFGTRILSGSLSQSRQIYDALARGVVQAKGYSERGDGDAIAELNTTRARYKNGSHVEILAASTTSARGPHVPSLKLDEVDELSAKRDVFESAMGMAQEDTKRGYPTSIIMTSTWHRPDGLMGEQIAKAEALQDAGKGRDLPLHRFCSFEVLQRCPEERSGPRLEKCPECPLVEWCHEEHRADPAVPPKAKLSDGHYSIASLIQKTTVVSRRVFNADYMIAGPRAEGLYFDLQARHISEDAEYRPELPVLMAIDSGVHTGAVFFQFLPARGPAGWTFLVHAFADYYAYDVPAQRVAEEVRKVAGSRCHDRIDRWATDPAGSAKNAVGPTVLAEYGHGGLPLHLCDRWPSYPGSVNDGIALVESFLDGADGKARLVVHPRCKQLIKGLRNYRRKQLQGQFLDKPEDPQHPYEDMVDALRGGLHSAFPRGREAPPDFHWIPRGHAVI